MSLVLGIDSGGSKTLAALASHDGEIVKLVQFGSLDPTSVPDWPERMRVLSERLGIKTGEILGAALGLSFHGELPEISAEQSRHAREIFGVKTIVENDVRIAFDGAFGGGAGALALAGTGSMAWASLAEADSPHVRAGGWGDLFGDEGSAYWIGREALARVSREVDGRVPATTFSRDLLAALSVDADSLLDWCYGTDDRRKGVAGLSRLTADLAECGDDVARSILESAGDELADTLQAAWRRAAGDRTMHWSFAGAVAENAIILSRIEARVGRAPASPVLPPVGGALLRAGSAAGWAITPRWLEKVRAGLKARTISQQTDNTEDYP